MRNFLDCILLGDEFRKPIYNKLLILQYRNKEFQSIDYAMVFRGKIPAEKRALTIYLRQESGLSYPKIAEKCNISTSSAERICNENLFQRQNSGHSRKRGRPRKISLGPYEEVIEKKPLENEETRCSSNCEETSHLQWTKPSNRKYSHVFQMLK